MTQKTTALKAPAIEISGEFDLESFLPYRLSVLSNTISRAIAKTYEKPFNLSVHEWRVIAILGRYPDSTATEIISYTAMDKVTVSRAMKRLQSKGLTVGREHENDRRCTLLKLTKEGQSIYQQVVPTALAYENALIDGLEQRERHQLKRLLAKLQQIALELEAE